MKEFKESPAKLMDRATPIIAKKKDSLKFMLMIISPRWVIQST